MNGQIQRPPKKPAFNWQSLLWVLVLWMAVALFFRPPFQGNAVKELTYTAFRAKVRQGAVSAITMTGNQIRGQMRPSPEEASPASGGGGTSGRGSASGEETAKPPPVEFQTVKPDVPEPGFIPFLEKHDVVITAKTQEGGAEIVKYLKTSAYYAPGRAIAKMVAAILDDSRIVISSSVILEGEYGHSDVSIGVPVVLGARGVERIIELELDDTKRALFDDSVASVKENISILRDNGFFG